MGISLRLRSFEPQKCGPLNLPFHIELKEKKISVGLQRKALCLMDQFDEHKLKPNSCAKF